MAFHTFRTVFTPKPTTQADVQFRVLESSVAVKKLTPGHFTF